MIGTETRRRVAGLLVALVAIIVTVAAANAGAEQKIRSSMLAGGGEVAAPGLQLRSAIGEPVAGSVTSIAGTLCSGVGCMGAVTSDATWMIFLPAIER